MSRLPFSLRDVFAPLGKREETIRSVAHLAIDVQDIYLYTQKDYQIAEKIGRHIAPQFAGLGVPTYWVTYKPPVSMRLNALNRIVCTTDFISPLNKNIRPAEIDKEVVKTDVSVVEGSRIHDSFQRAGCRIVAVTGFTAAVCVLQSACDLQALGYQVVVLEDGTDMDPDFDFVYRQMEKNGVLISSSQEFFAELGNKSFSPA